MSGNKGSNVPADPSPTTEEDQNLDSAQEAVPVPLFWGERTLPLIWISRVGNVYAREVPNPGKK